MIHDHWGLRHQSLGDGCDRKTFFAEILIPKVCEQFTNLGSFQFNRRSLAADIDHAEMIVVLQRQRCELLLCFLKSYNKPPVRGKTKEHGLHLRLVLKHLRSATWLPRQINAQRFTDCGKRWRSRAPHEGRWCAILAIRGSLPSQWFPCSFPCSGLSLVIIYESQLISSDIFLVNKYSVTDGGRQNLFSQWAPPPIHPSGSVHQPPVPVRRHDQAPVNNKNWSHDRYVGSCHSGRALRLVR